MADEQNYPPIQIQQQPPLATVKIASDETVQGYIIVNASDFDAATMTKYAEPKAEKSEKAK